MVKKKTIPEIIFEYLKKKNGLNVTKNKICRDLKLERNSVDYGCRILRKQKKIGFCYRYYWV